MLRFLTAGESHGPALTVIVEGLPAGLKLTAAQINTQLSRRQKGFGRGDRMQIEQDQVEITAGLRHGQTLGSPLCLVIHNRDWKNWQDSLRAEGPAPRDLQRLVRPRPGHADLVGALKYNRYDFRDILERASARETAARVAAGAVARVLLRELGVSLGSWVERIGPVATKPSALLPRQLAAQAEKSDVHCPEARIAGRMRTEIIKARKAGDTLGGVFRVSAWGLLPGLGSHVQWDRRLDMRLAGAIMSIPAIKGVAFGLGFEAAASRGSKVHDVITFSRSGYGRRTNHAGGVEGGISTGQPLVVQAAMKPISTLRKPLASVDIRSKKRLRAGYERSDVCAVPAAAIVGEAMVAMTLTGIYQEKFAGDALSEMLANVRTYRRYLAKR